MTTDAARFQRVRVNNAQAALNGAATAMKAALAALPESEEPEVVAEMLAIYDRIEGLESRLFEQEHNLRRKEVDPANKS